MKKEEEEINSFFSFSLVCYFITMIFSIEELDKEMEEEDNKEEDNKEEENAGGT